MNNISTSGGLTFMEKAVVVKALYSKHSQLSLKSFVLCKAKIGYVWKSALHTGRELTQCLNKTHDSYQLPCKKKAVLELMSKLLGLGYKLFIDNWYISFKITSLLLQNNTDCIGTLHKDRKSLTKDVNKQNAKLKVRDCIVRLKVK